MLLATHKRRAVAGHDHTHTRARAREREKEGEKQRVRGGGREGKRAIVQKRRMFTENQIN